MRIRVIALAALLGIVCMGCADRHAVDEEIVGTDTQDNSSDDQVSEEEELPETTTLAPYQSSELVAMARYYYRMETGYLAPEAAGQDNGDGTTTIQLYEVVQVDEETWHTSTSAWYTVDVSGKGKDDTMRNPVRFKNLTLADLASYMPIPVRLQYVSEGEAHNEWEITDAEVINACMDALKNVTIGEKTDERASDAGEILRFELADGNVWELVFEDGRLLRNGECYETEGYVAVHDIIKDYLTEEGQWY